MIAIGLFCNGPELNHAPISKAFNRVATAISEVFDDSWAGTLPGLHVGFYVDGSAGSYDEIKGLAAVRFSRKKKILLVNVRVPARVVRNFEASYRFLVDSLHDANALAADTFARKGDEPFNLMRAEDVVNRAKLYFSDEEFRDRIDSQILPGN